MKVLGFIMQRPLTRDSGIEPESLADRFAGRSP